MQILCVKMQIELLSICVTMVGVVYLVGEIIVLIDKYIDKHMYVYKTLT